MKQCKTSNEEVSSDLLTKGIRLTLNEFLILEEFSCRAGNRLKSPTYWDFLQTQLTTFFCETTFHLLYQNTNEKKKEKLYNKIISHEYYKEKSIIRETRIIQRKSIIRETSIIQRKSIIRETSIIQRTSIIRVLYRVYRENKYYTEKKYYKRNKYYTEKKYYKSNI